MTTPRVLILTTVMLMLAGTARAEPPLWRVTGSRGTAVLFGSIHLLPSGLNWKPAELDAAVAKADELWFEIPIGGEADVHAARLLQERGTLPRGDTLAAHLPPAMLDRLHADAARVGLSAEAVDSLKPWLADATLSIAADARSGAQASQGVERQIDALAPARVRRHALESAADQIGVLANGSMAEQVDLFAVTLDEVEKKPETYQELVDAWVAADLRELRKEALDPLRTVSPRAYRALITDRNRRWCAEIARRLKHRGSIVVVVGVGHLIGPDGLPTLLRAAGLTVEGPTE